MKKEKKLKAGRKSRYEIYVEPRLLEIAAWCRDGLTDEDIWKNLGIGKDSFYRYKREHKELSDALKENKEIADIKVENSLNKNANGYDYEEEVVVMKKEVFYNDDGKREKEVTYPVTVTVKKHKEGETKAQQFWLQNRKPKVWRNQADVNVVVKKLEDFINEDNS